MGLKIRMTNKTLKQEIIDNKEAEIQKIEKMSDGARQIPLEIRKIVTERDKGICQICGGHGDTMDHVIPWNIVRQHRRSNLVVACHACNKMMGDIEVKDLAAKKKWMAEKLRNPMAKDHWINLNKKWLAKKGQEARMSSYDHVINA